MQIKEFIESSLIEWEGKIASVLFLPGCNLRCHYCHAAHLVCHPERTESIPLGQVLDSMRRQGEWLDGAVITGGEPTLHEGDLLDLIDELHDVPLEVMVETNGTRPGWVARLVQDGRLEAIAMDVKAPLTAEDYRRVAGADVEVEAVRRSIRLIKRSGLAHEFRITVVPGLVGEGEVARIAPELEGADVVALQNFLPDHCLEPALREVRPFEPEALDEMAELLRPVAERLVVRGRDHAAMAGSPPAGS